MGRLLDFMLGEEYWIDLQNLNRVHCKDVQCKDETLQGGNNRTMSLAHFDDITIERDKACVVGKERQVMSKNCVDKKYVVCEWICAFVTTNSITTTTSATVSTEPIFSSSIMSSSDSPTTLLSQIPSTISNRIPCPPVPSKKSPTNSKFYKISMESSGFVEANNGCESFNMELATIENNDDILSIYQTLGKNRAL